MRQKSAVHFALAIAVGSALAACGHDSPTKPGPTPCTFALSTSSLSFGAAGGPGSVSVTTASHCTWTAVSDRGWMSITSGASGTGNGTVNVSLSPNPSETTRTGTLTIAGQTVAVQEEGLGACTV